VKISLSAAALLSVFAHLATAQVAILHIQVIEGEGAVNAPGSRNSRPLAVEVTDETGKPVEGAAVSFHLPEEGPGGTFGNGLRTDVIVTDARGRANVRTLLLNRTPGRVEIRIVASKEQARAGTVSFQYIAEPSAIASKSAPKGVPNGAPKSAPKVLRGPLKWAVLAALAGGATAAGAVLAGKSSGTASASPTPGATGTTAVGITIGSPSLTIGKP
jgi:hypothetical protein